MVGFPETEQGHHLTEWGTEAAAGECAGEELDTRKNPGTVKDASIFARTRRNRTVNISGAKALGESVKASGWGFLRVSSYRGHPQYPPQDESQSMQTKVRHNEFLIVMSTEHLDINALLSDADADWQSMSAGSVIGHVHLQVGAIPEAETFYANVLGMKIKARYPGGTFYASGDYHHHLATNGWNSRGAKPLAGGETGLAEVVLRATKAEHDAIAVRAGQTGEILTLADPCNIPLTITMKDETHAG